MNPTPKKLIYLRYKIIQKVFSPVFGKPCWNIRRGQWNSAIGLEFGKPHLEFHKREKTSKSGLKKLIHRTAVLNGDWGLRFEYCHWNAYQDDKKIADHASISSPDKVAYVFSGQALKDLIVIPHLGRSIFLFDLGGKIETRPDPDNQGDQWDFSTPSGKFFSYRNDGKYSFESGLIPGDKIIYKDFTF